MGPDILSFGPDFRKNRIHSAIPLKTKIFPAGVPRPQAGYDPGGKSAVPWQDGVIEVRLKKAAGDKRRIPIG